MLAKRVPGVNGILGKLQLVSHKAAKFCCFASLKSGGLFPIKVLRTSPKRNEELYLALKLSIWSGYQSLALNMPQKHCNVMAKTALERRIHPRLPLSIPVFVRGTDDQGKDFLEFATALNISAGGILLATRRNLPKSATLSLEIPVAPMPQSTDFSHSVRTLKARLVRLTHGEKCNLLGMKFPRPIGTPNKASARGKDFSTK
jgi:hypothetical protein